VTKKELLDALGTSRDEVLRIVRGLSPERLEEGRYEGGWNGRQILAHIAAIEWTFPRLIDVARDTPPAGEQLPTRPMQGGVDAYNERQVAKRAHLSVAELVDEFERNRAATIHAVEQTDDALLARPVRSAAGVTGSLARVLYAVTVDHALGHAQDIAGPARS
jgi:uncharacterized damage-inducible protein DinB